MSAYPDGRARVTDECLQIHHKPCDVFENSMNQRQFLKEGSERPRKMMQWLVEGKELTSRHCEAEFGVIRAVTAVDFGKLIEMGLADKLGAGRSTRYCLKGPV